MNESPRPPGLDDLLNYVSTHMGGEDAHWPMYVRWENRHTIPAEVCNTCSNPETGTWVPVSFCDKAQARLDADPNCTYTYGVIASEENE